MLEDLINFAFTRLVTCSSLVVTTIIMWTLRIFILYVHLVCSSLAFYIYSIFDLYTENLG